MANNNLILLDTVIEEREAQHPNVTPGDIFEQLACELTLRPYGLSVEEARDGIVGGSNDGGVDGMYTLLEGRYLRSDSHYLEESTKSDAVPPGASVNLVLVQAKRETGFNETVVEKVSDSMARCLNLEADEADLSKLYSQELIEHTSRFRTVLKKYARRGLKVTISFYYVTRGDTSNVNSKVEVKLKDLEKQFSDVISNAVGETELLGATELWDRECTAPSYDLEMEIAEYINGGDSHVALVKIADYIKFLSDEEGKIRQQIFDGNVRDYQGLGVAVNKEIALTAETAGPDGPDFWWLNNGVTMLCSSVTIAGRTFHLGDVQVVNGLQSSYTLHETLQELPDDHPIRQKRILVRILQTSDDPVRDAVIRATNSQTAVQPASLRATDQVQRDIESYFFHHDWYYDRRKNFYRNGGKPADRIIAISWLAQAITAMGFSEPNISRARPASLLKDDKRYAEVFDSNVRVETFFKVAVAQHKIDSYLATDQAHVSGAERTNTRFHTAMLVASAALGKPVKKLAQLTSLSDDFAQEELIARCVVAVRASLEYQTRVTNKTEDAIAKGPQFPKFLLDEALPVVTADEANLASCAWPWLTEEHREFLQLVATSDDFEEDIEGTPSRWTEMTEDMPEGLVEEAGRLFPKGWLVLTQDGIQMVEELAEQIRGAAGA